MWAATRESEGGPVPHAREGKCVEEFREAELFRWGEE